MNLESIRSQVASMDTDVLVQQYALYCDLQSLGVTDIVTRDVMELELARRGVFEDLGPYRTINS